MGTAGQEGARARLVGWTVSTEEAPSDRLLDEMRAVRVTLQYFEHWLSAGQFAYVDELLQSFPVEAATPATSLTVLTITFHGKAHLKHREAFLARVADKLATAFGTERAERLLEHRR